MHRPKISVLILLYNSGAFLRETIDSVLAQTFSDFELLLMDDGSSDDTADIVRTYKYPRIRYERCPHDFSGTFNWGLSQAKGKYVALFDHDDIMVPNRLQVQFDFMETHTDIVACGAWMQEFGVSSNKWLSVSEYDRIILEFIGRKAIYMCNPTLFIRKESIDNHNLQYKPGYYFHADIKFWFDTIKIGKVANIPEILVWYRTSKTQTSKQTRLELQKTAEVVFHELIDYLFSGLDDKEEVKSLLIKDVMPVIKEMTDLSFFSSNIYFSLMREIIEGLYKNGFINLKEPLSSQLQYNE
ncbi:glycosyltransferase family 2 protein [Proteiniphilum sp. X52]|uniref:glycosyltransferase family 2 protein n=1 Tax=Proteiniphilum sp. X52 TaxID=2382159 RepID=UPI000F0A7143|nr:glycosyltransferase family 2 protein [Proteiniphilum sp. X52]RNC63284.1 glycosyltransferase family 2 protein [Proteiniphilum sp. X52]